MTIYIRNTRETKLHKDVLMRNTLKSPEDANRTLFPILTVYTCSESFRLWSRRIRGVFTGDLFKPHTRPLG